MIVAFVTVLLGLTAGVRSVELAVGQQVAEVEILLDEVSVGLLVGEPWRLEVDFGSELAPHRLVALARDGEGRELEQVEQWINLPHSPVEIGILLTSEAGEPPAAAQIFWSSVLESESEPESLALTFDGEPLEVKDPRSIELPAYDPREVHFLRAELRFPSAVDAVAEAVFGGEFGATTSTEMQAVAVTLDPGTLLSPAAELGDLVVGKDGLPLSVLAVDGGEAEVVVVTDLAALWVLRELRKSNLQAIPTRPRRRDEFAPPRPSSRWRHVIPRMPVRDGLRPGDRVRFVMPVPGLEQAHEYRIFPVSRPFSLDDGGFFELMTRVNLPDVSVGRQRLADAVAVAGLEAFASGRRRHVVLVVGKAPIDGSRWDLSAVRRYLNRLNVPLSIWSLRDFELGLERPGRKTATPVADGTALPRLDSSDLGRTLEISSIKTLNQAIHELRRDLDAQRILWVDGLQLPDQVAIASSARGARLAGAMVERDLEPVASPGSRELASLPGSPWDPVSPFGDVVEVELVNVEVWVTDRKGNPREGLSLSDFEVLEDGEAVDVTYFSEIRAPGERPIPVEDEVEPADDQEHLVVYFDQSRLDQTSRQRAIADLRQFLASGKIHAERVSILRQDKDLHVEAGFGSSPAALEAALSRVESSTEAVHEARTKRTAFKALREAWRSVQTSPRPCEIFAALATGEIESYAHSSRAQVTNTLRHLYEAVGFVAGVPGVKILLYLSDGLEINPGVDLLSFVYEVCPSSRTGLSRSIGPRDSGELFEQAARRANASRVTIYALKASGLQASYLGVTELPDSTPVSFSTLNTMLASESEGLGFLADRTGGRALRGRNSYFDGLVELATDVANYYSLAYEPPHPGDRAEHRIEVRVRADGETLEARHRSGYRDKGAEERVSELLESAVYVGQVSNPLEIRLSTGQIEVSDEGVRTLPVRVVIPGEHVAYLPAGVVTGGEDPTALIELHVATHDPSSHTVAVTHKRFELAQPAEGPSAEAEISLRIELHEGIEVVAIGLRDEVTREMSVAVELLP
jgi:VWFA-related protein